MGEKAFECADILKPLLKKYLIIGFSLVIAINITLCVAGFICVYYKLKKKVYHTFRVYIYSYKRKKHQDLNKNHEVEDL